METILNTLMTNWKRFQEENPEIREAIKDGYEVAAYDEETQLIICVELEDKNLKVKIIEDAHVIRRGKDAQPTNDPAGD